ncbi:FixH family protein [Flavihumibacter sp. UBA7668]|uniref:FixH family protein n=1 Tax=Flavihumibacter sp. UBA7668 TaxID=1946542 RepID=UPI0025C20A0D|nr:FixH family protein [Flavihumibacter sp. UBA7668]
MALNFGHKIILVFIVFGLLMGTLIYMSVKTEFELVSKDYYKEELAYQEVIDARKNAETLSSSIKLNYDDKQLQILMPMEMKLQVDSGEIYFYCPADAKKDTILPLQPDTSGMQVIQIGETVAPAAYKLRIKWNAAGKSYYQENYMNLQ